MQIYIVDDSDANLALFSMIARKIGDDVHPVCFMDPREALDACAVTMPDVVVVDFMMPGLDGHEFVAKVRSLPQSEAVPIVMITAATDRLVRHRALDLGVTDFLIKPVDTQELKARLTNIIALRRGHLQLQDRNRWLAESESRFRNMADHAPAIVWVKDADGRYTYLNARWHEFTGHAPGEDEQYGWFRFVHPEDLPAAAEAFLTANAQRQPLRAEYRLRHALDGWRWVIDTAVPRFDDSGTFLGYVGSCIDVDERKRAEERERALAMRDPLTGLPNRRTLRDVLARELARTERGGPSFALLLADLDDFKQVNDTLGHAAGDELLVEASSRLQGCARQGDVVVRLGGDEFAIVMADMAGPADAAALASRVVAELGRPFVLRGVEVRTGASVGIAACPERRSDPDDLLARADLALYAAKEAGRGTWRFFSAAMQDRVREAATLDRDLRQALERGQFTLHYQPIVGVKDQQPRMAEALLRWEHPERGVVRPDEFLAAAERNRLIIPLTFWTVTQALQQVASWRAAGITTVPVAVNLALPALEGEEVVRHIEETLRAAGLPGEALVVEVTEGVMTDGGRTVAALEALRATGVRVAVDDFGAGCSSLARLRDLPLDLLKIDRAFLTTLSPKGEAILRAVVELGNGLGVPTVVEGVETPGQLQLVQDVGASCAQGYLVGQPMPASEIADWIRARVRGRRPEHPHHGAKLVSACGAG